MSHLNLIYGKHAVEEFILKHPNMIKTIWVKDPHYFNKFSYLKDDGINIIKTTEQKLSKMFFDNSNHQGIVAEVKEYNYKPIAEALKELEQKENSIVLLLDKIHDPHNFGAILRSASLFGVDQIVILEKNQVLINSTVVKTSSGTVYDLNISKVSNLTNVINQLKTKGYWIYSSNLNKDAQDIRKVEFAKKTVIIVGNEHNGVSELVTKNSDINIFIPSTRTIDSFNVSVATSIILYEVASKIKKI